MTDCSVLFENALRFLVAGTLTQNRMTVVEGWFGGVESVFTNDKTRANVPPALTLTLRDHLSINSTAVTIVNDKGLKVSIFM